MNWTGGLWNPIVGMSVDPVSGDLYVAATTDIYRITPSETVQLVKGGFTSVNGLDVLRESSDDPGLLLVADGGTTNLVKAIALDNLAAAPMVVASAPNLRAASFGVSLSGGAWNVANVNRTVVVHNFANAGTSTTGTTPVRSNPLIEIEPKSGPLKVWSSSPSAADVLPRAQASSARTSSPTDSSYSRARVSLRYKDGISRSTCARTGDPGASAPYDPPPADPLQCQKPRGVATGNCDNVDPIAAGGAGSFDAPGNDIVSCQVCGGPSPCEWAFRITRRHAGDNYKVWFSQGLPPTIYSTTSEVYTAWKHLHIERERMCERGGLLFADYGATGECGGAGQPACCGTGGQPPCNEILLFASTTNVGVGDNLVVWDERRTFESIPVTEARTVVAPGPTNNGDGSVTVTLDSPLPHSVFASSRLPPSTTPNFANGHSGGVCDPSLGFDEADASALHEAFGGAFVSYHVPNYGRDGSGTVPRYSPVDFIANGCVPSRFSNIWFQNYVAGTLFSCPPEPAGFANGCRENNYIHVLGADQSSVGRNGESAQDFNASYVYLDDILLTCAGATGGCPPEKLARTNRSTVRHEVAHQFRVNSCSPDEHDMPGRNAWCGNPGGTCVNPNPPPVEEWCPMNLSGTAPTDNNMRGDGIDQFCREDLILGDPNCAPSTPRAGAMRTVEDPQ